ncbi:hypothetical protein ACSBR2_012389 [Camellia fascicularis]
MQIAMRTPLYFLEMLFWCFDSTEIDDIERFSDIKKGDVLAIRSLRNLKEIEKHAPLLPHLSLILRFPGDSPVVISIR